MDHNNEISQTKVSIPQQMRSKEKREALLKSGEVLFAKRGYDNVTAKDICAHAGVSVGTFYRYFLDKKQLLLTLSENRIQDFFPDVILEEMLHPYIGTKKLIQHYFKQREELELLQAVQSLVLQEPELATKMNKMMSMIEEKLANRLEILKEKGYTWPDLEVNIAAWSVLSIVFASRNKEELQDEAGVEKITMIIVQMLFKPEYHRLDNEKE